jgi:hypothetical protein
MGRIQVSKLVFFNLLKEKVNNMCSTCGCNYPNVDHAMANSKGDNPMGMPIAPKPSSIQTATPKKPGK